MASYICCYCGKKPQFQVAVLVLTAHTNHTNLSVLMGARILLARIVAKRLQIQVAVLVLAVRTKRINLSNIDKFMLY